MAPVQVWLPWLRGTLANGPVRRDMQRAFDAWNGESTVWLLPWLDRVRRWQDEPRDSNVALPSESLERVDVYHIGSNGYAAGLGAESRFGDKTVSRLLDFWLNCGEVGTIEMLPGTDRIQFPVPDFNAERVRYRMVDMWREPEGMIPIVATDESLRTTTSMWPPEPIKYRTVSPDEESAEYYGGFDLIDHEGIPIAVNRNNKQIKSLFVRTIWPEPLGNLISRGDGVDILSGLDRMRKLSAQAGSDRRQNAIDARREAGIFVSDGHSNRDLTLLRPRLAEGGDEAMLFTAAEFKFEARSLSELLGNERFGKFSKEPVAIRRAWGSLGLFWSLLLDRLESGSHFGSCARCQRIIEGDKRKKFCSKSDNPQCFNGRRASDQSRSRERKTSPL